MAETVDSIVVRVVADVDDAQRKVAAYGSDVEQAFGRVDGAVTRSDAGLARSAASQRDAYRELGKQLSQVATDAIAGTDGFVLLARHGIETAATLEKFGGTVGEIGALLSGPWGVAAQFAVGILGQLAGKYLDNEHVADAAAQAAQRFANRQSSIAHFIDLATGKLVEQNQALVQNEILTNKKGLRANNELLKNRRKELNEAINDLPGRQVFVSERQPFAKVIDPKIARIIDAANGDASKLSAGLAALARQRPELEGTIARIIEASAAIVDLERANARLNRTISGLGGDETAFAGAAVEAVEQRVAVATARTELERAQAELTAVQMRRSAAAAQGGAALKRYERDLTAATRKVQDAAAAERQAAEARQASLAVRPRTSAPAPIETKRAERRRAGDAQGGAPEPKAAIAAALPIDAPSVAELHAEVAAIAAAWANIDVSELESIDTRQLERVGQISATLADDLSKGLADAIINGKSLGDVLVDSFARAGAALIQSKILRLLDPTGDGSAGFVKQVAGVLGALTGTGAPGRASGGHVSAGRLYRVNETGVEGFRPAGSGKIVPLGQMATPWRGGGVTVVQPMNVSFAGAITTPELMAQFKAYADGVGQAAVMGGAAMAQAKLAKRAARALPR